MNTQSFTQTPLDHRALLRTEHDTTMTIDEVSQKPEFVRCQANFVGKTHHEATALLSPRQGMDERAPSSVLRMFKSSSTDVRSVSRSRNAGLSLPAMVS